MEKKKNADEITKKLEYIGLDLEKIPGTLKYVENIDFRPNLGIEENQYRQYRFISPKELEILLTPCNRGESTKTKYKKSKPLIYYIDPKTEEEMINYETFIKMVEEMNIAEIEKIEEEQQELCKKMPFKIRYPGNYLWQIYYSEVNDKYFMMVPTEDRDFSTFFYILKKQLEKKKSGKIFVPICNMDYSKELLNKTEIDSLINYLYTITENWPSVYEVSDKTEKKSLQIIGQTEVLEKIKSEYKVKLTSKIDAGKFFKLVKALYILQTELPSCYKFNTQVDKQGTIEFLYNEEILKYDSLSDWINLQYKEMIKKEKESVIEYNKYKEKLNILQKQSEELESEYISKEKQISVFLECKKTFFGKVKYFFKYSGKKTKKKEEKENNEIAVETEKNEDSQEIEYIDEILKEQYKLEELVAKGKKVVESENNLKNIILDINALKLKIVNLNKKIENATAYIQEIDNHKKSIFEFWKYSNKDEVQALNEGEEEQINVKPHTKNFDYDEDFEEFGNTIDKLQRNKLNKEELDAIYITTTDQLIALNKIRTNSLEPKELDGYLKKVKADFKAINKDETIDIFDGLEEDTRKVKKLANKEHREHPKNKYEILGVAKQYKIADYRANLSQINWRINDALDKITLSENLSAYLWKEEEENIDANEINVFSLCAENEILDGIEKSEKNKINLFKINFERGSNILAFSNCVYFDNQNKTLPIGMDNDTRIIGKIKDADIKLESKKTVRIAKMDEDDIASKLNIKTINVIEYTVKKVEEEK